MTVYENIIRPILDAAAALGADDVIIHTAEVDAPALTHVSVRGHVRTLENVPPVSWTDIELFLRDVGLEPGENPVSGADGYLGETVCFTAERAGTGSAHISFRHLHDVPRYADASNSGNLTHRNTRQDNQGKP